MRRPLCHRSAWGTLVGARHFWGLCTRRLCTHGVPEWRLAQVKAWVTKLEQSLCKAATVGEGAGAHLFATRALWRDMLAFTWNITTIEGRSAIHDMIDATAATTAPRHWQLASEVTVSTATGGETSDAWLTFETEAGLGKAHVRLSADGQAQTLLTTLQELHGHPPAIGPHRRKGTVHGSVLGRRYKGQHESAQDPFVVIIGGGQGGMALGAWLQLLDVPYVILDRNSRPGDSWRNRYPSLVLHDPVWYDHMPFLPFPKSWPVFTPRDKMADWLEMYCKAMDLQYWTSSRVMKATRCGGRWNVQDLWEQGARQVTMVQRSGTLVLSTESVLELGLGPLYSEQAIAQGLDHESADLLATTIPYRLQVPRWRRMAEQMRERDQELHRRLERVGFLLDFGMDGTGVFGKSLREGGGFYINVGASELLADGCIRLRSGAGVERLDRDAVVLATGERLPADLIVYATGYGSMHRFVADIVDADVAAQVGRVWGLGAGTRKDPGPWEGELRNMWKPTAVEGLWFQGGNLAQSRHYSRFLALQLQAQRLGMPTPVYGRAAVHHNS